MSVTVVSRGRVYKLYYLRAAVRVRHIAEFGSAVDFCNITLAKYPTCQVGQQPGLMCARYQFFTRAVMQNAAEMLILCKSK